MNSGNLPFVIFQPTYDELFERLANILGVTDDMTYAEIDGRFFGAIERAGYSESVQALIVTAWLRATHHDNQRNPEPLTGQQRSLLIGVFERLIAH